MQPMLATERKRFHKLIDNSALKNRTVERLHSVVDTVLSDIKEGISLKEQQHEKSKFTLLRAKTLVKVSAIEKDEVTKIFDQLEIVLDRVLENSIVFSVISITGDTTPKPHTFFTLLLEHPIISAIIGTVIGGIILAFVLKKYFPDLL